MAVKKIRPGIDFHITFRAKFGSEFQKQLFTGMVRFMFGAFKTFFESRHKGNEFVVRDDEFEKLNRALGIDYQV